MQNEHVELYKFQKCVSRFQTEYWLLQGAAFIWTYHVQ